MLTFIVLGLAVGMGALSPRFNLANPQMASAGLGGISFMLLALLCTGLLTTMTFSTALGLMLFQHHIDHGLSWHTLSIACGLHWVGLARTSLP